MTLFVLGAPDPEMAAIERVLVAAKQRVAYATVNGRRVHAGNAYQANGIMPRSDVHDGLMLVECGGPALAGAVIDHHRPGDPGYGRPPAEFMAASSIGQVLGHLAACGLLPADHRPAEYRLIAAADHCLAAAYRGECPGVDPDALMEWRVRTRAEFQGRPMASVMADVQHAIETLLAAPQLCARCGRLCQAERPGEPATCGVCAAPLPVAHLPAPVPECPEAAARLGLAFRVVLEERGHCKEVLQAAPPAAIEAFLAEHRAAGRETYGDPARGFAGAYL